MKKRFYSFICCIVVLQFFACSNMTEEIYLNKDGSGKFEMYTDMVVAAKSAMMLFNSISPDGETISEDSLMAKIYADVFQGIDGYKDSTESFIAIVPDSLIENEHQREMISKSSYFMRGGPDVGYMKTGISFEFKNVDELNEYFQLMSSNKIGMGKDDMVNKMMMDMFDFKTNYSFQKNTLTRKSNLQNKEELDEAGMKMMEMMLGEATIKTIIHLPKGAKKYSKDNNVVKSDNTISYEYDILELMSGEQNSDFEIKMKRK